MIILVAGIGLISQVAGYSPSYMPNTNYRSTYTPNLNYKPIDSPTQLASSNNLQPVQLGKTNAIDSAAQLHEMVQGEFRVVDESDEPIPNAQIAGHDGYGNNFQETTNNDGYATIKGAFGDWQFTVYAQGYFNKLVGCKLEYNADVMVVQLKKIVPEKIIPEGNRFTGNNIVAEENINKTIPNWLCESNGYSEQNSETSPEQSADSGARG
ncbi:MAG: carboxypeptidase-like regulatory domain-containing protein [Methanothrix sp.]|nr:carboxypeptidase-like regulatory domain-containing protein [Methanothrix sp.]